ncbi:hypothetical protein [Tateyamaria pelophila]|uniref:hypothetical protein n=1 Tax=Tateyamaria pelophila TaxID=328415 RepID=UPI001CBFF03C|nr:hypothetical protein [Tateyamaria pelophila]
MLLFLTVLAACNTAGPRFRGLPATTVTIDGSTFDVRVNGRLAEAIRTNMEYAPRFGPVQSRAGKAMQLVSGCTVKEVRGDQAVALGILDCGGTPSDIDQLQPQGEYECFSIDRYISPATNEVVLDLDCAPV